MEEKEREKLIQVGEVFLAKTLLMTAGLVETNGMFLLRSLIFSTCMGPMVS